MRKFFIGYMVMLVLFMGYMVRHPSAKVRTCADVLAKYHPDVSPEAVEACRKRRSM